MKDHGVNFLRFILSHPSPDEIVALYKTIGIENAPTVNLGEELRYSAELQTPRDLKTLF